MEKVKYIHDEVTHNMSSPNIIIPIILNIVKVENVVDFGCGIGTWLKAFKNNGIKEVLGLDGKWVNIDLLHKYISEDEFKCVDLEKPITLDKKYDLVVSLEVVEHISENSAETFIKSLVDAGKIILFSAAIPGQGGFNHINEQWPSYWNEKFKAHNYVFHDIIRGHLWDMPEIEPFYKQNMFLVAHESINLPFDNQINFERNIVHPDYFLDVVNGIKRIESGRRGISFYILALMKRIRNYFKRENK